MAPDKVIRENVTQLTDLPNIGPASAADLRILGYHSPTQIIGQDPLIMYQHLCDITGQRHDPCVIDVFMSITDFLQGNPPQPWWKFTAKRKKVFSQ